MILLNVTRLYILKNKFDAISIFSTFHKMINTQFSVQIKSIKFDNKKEYFNQILSSYLER